MVYSSVSIPWLAEHTVSVNDVAKQFVCLARTRLLYQLGTLPRLDAFATMKPDNNIWYKNTPLPSRYAGNISKTQPFFSSG